MTFNVYLKMNGRWCRVGRDYHETERQQAQTLAETLASDRDPVRIVQHEPGEELGVTIWESKP